jgi:5-methylcytosine-specific restriction endonuclease McrA
MTTKVCSKCKEAKPLSDFTVGAFYCKPCTSEYQQQRRADRPEEHRKWEEDHPEQNRRNKRQWEIDHPERMRTSKRKGNWIRRARKLNRFVEDVDPIVVYARDRGICGICRKPIKGDFHVDHIIPLARDGEHSYANVQVAHSSCNIKKGTKL